MTVRVLESTCCINILQVSLNTGTTVVSISIRIFTHSSCLSLDSYFGVFGKFCFA